MNDGDATASSPRRLYSSRPVISAILVCFAKWATYGSSTTVRAEYFTWRPGGAADHAFRRMPRVRLLITRWTHTNVSIAA